MSIMYLLSIGRFQNVLFDPSGIRKSYIRKKGAHKQIKTKYLKTKQNKNVPAVKAAHFLAHYL